jgi:GDPmannose 4,6-dehydratase
MPKTAFITGITGQDGSYLARFLRDKNYKVHGLIRWDAVDGTERIRDILGDITLHNGDVTDANNITGIIADIKPDEIYHLAALSHVGVSFETPSSVLDIVTKGALNIFDAVRICDLRRKTRIYNAASSEMFGNTKPPQNENSAMQPQSPYATAKLAAYHLAKIYRDSYDMFIANGILFNHESPNRGDDFVTQKIAKAVARIKAGGNEPIVLGNLNARRDWGDARDYVRGMWMMLNHDTADDFVLASGKSHSVRDFVNAAFNHIGIEVTWQGEGLDETAINAKTGETIVRIDPQFFRPNEVHHLQGDASKARKILRWKPEHTFDDLVKTMVDSACQDS